MRSRIVLFGALAVIVVSLILLSLLDQYIVDFLWFSALGYRQVFRVMLTARAGIFAAIWLLAFIPIVASGLSALHGSHDQERLHVVRRPEEMVEVNLPELIRSLGDRVPWRLIVAGAAALLAIFAAQGESSNWDTYLKAFYGTSFGLKDPAFGRDIGFYVFTLPLLEELRDLFMMVLFLAAGIAVAIYWARGGLDFRESPPRVSSSAAAHFSILLAFFFLQRALTYWLDRPELLLHTNGVVWGLRYVDHLLWQPGLWLLVALSLLAAGLCVFNVGEPGLRIPVLAGVVVFGPALILNLIAPVIESLRVRPDELRVERPYIARNIESTRHAYKLGDVDVRPFAGKGQLTRASLQQDSPTIANIRLWDPRPLLATYRQLQNIRSYYDFRDVDLDRYWIDDKYTQVMLSPRELNLDLLAPGAQTWVNQHLKFTHGFGLVMSPVNAKDPEGLPIFFVKNIPPSTVPGINITQPGIYFGQEASDYAVVKAASPEFDYPSGADNVTSFYQGNGGVRVSGFWSRLFFSIFFRDINLLVTQNIIPGSRILIRRNINERVAYIAPFLNQDHDPYIVLHDGRIVWILDCYTTSDHYPYSQRNADGINYIRNSVKVVVDAYSGDTDFYVSDPDDPVIQTWSKIFPGLFKPLSAMPADLHAHIRYPEDFFLIQADIFRTYHMTDPSVFYNREDLWSFPTENYAGDTVPMQPYYVIMRLPGQTRAEYILMLPMVPAGRDNMIAWLAARCDGDDYGHLFEYAFSKDKLFYGPFQIQARINQNPEISQQYSLWNQMGSKVILGNLLVIPVEDSLLYVEPLYIRAESESGQLPELQRVLASDSERTVMADDLDSTLAALLRTGPQSNQPIVAALPPPTAIARNGAGGPSPPGTALKPALTNAASHYQRAMAALKTGDWAQFGDEMQELGRELGPAADSTPH